MSEIMCSTHRQASSKEHVLVLGVTYIVSNLSIDIYIEQALYTVQGTTIKENINSMSSKHRPASSNEHALVLGVTYIVSNLCMNISIEQALYTVQGTTIKENLNAMS